MLALRSSGAMRRSGFTLIEVLITLVILMFGLLGIAGLMAKGQRASFEAYQRQAGLAIANDMAERMRANRTQAPAYAAGAPTGGTLVGASTRYANLLSHSITDCGAGNCTPADLVTYDLAQWEGLLNGYGERQDAGATLIGGITTARGCIEDRTVAAAACPAAPANIGVSVSRNYTVSVVWQGNEPTFAPPAADVCGAGQYGTENRRRVISLDLLLLLPCW